MNGFAKSLRYLFVLLVIGCSSGKEDAMRAPPPDESDAGTSTTNGKDTDTPTDTGTGTDNGTETDTAVVPIRKTPRATTDEPLAQYTDAPRDRGFTRVPIFYATDRQRGGTTPNDFYGARRRDDSEDWEIEFGRCEVSIPYKHQPGEIERPSIWKLEFRENPAKHVVLLRIQPIDRAECLPHLQQAVAASESKSALVFVHGFNVDFAGAARRTAQMKYDLGFDGAAILYSWPAPKNYVECEGNATWTQPHLMDFLTEYVEKSGAQQIHLVAHSMGTRVLSNALRELAQSRQDDQSLKYNQIILAAPDIDASIFKRQIAPKIAAAAERVSIYTSSADLALVASKAVHKYVRLGEGGQNISVFPELRNIEVLDATDINESLLGHGYYGDSPTFLSDVRKVLAGASAEQRRLQRRLHYFMMLP